MENYQGTVFGKLRIPLHIFHEGYWGFRDVIVNYRVDPDLLVWDGEKGDWLYTPYNDSRIPEDVRATIRPTIESKRKAAEQAGKPFFDGQNLRLVDYGIIYEGIEEKREKLVLFMEPTSYFTNSGTNRSYDNLVLRDSSGSPISMRGKYGVDVLNLNDWMANAIGVNTTLISEPSGAIVMVLRSDKLDQYPNLYGVAAAGFMDRLKVHKDGTKGDVVAGTPNPFRTVKRESEEEAGVECPLDDPKYGFKLLGVGRTLDDLHAELWGETISPWTVEKILSAPKSGKYEQLRIFPVEFSPKQVLPYVVKTIKEVPKGVTSGRDAWTIGESPVWVPAHVYATIQSLIKHYGFENVMEELERSLN